MVSPKDRLHRIPHLYHFTDVRNLPSIQEIEGVYSTAILNEMGVTCWPGGDQQSLDLDVQLGMNQYVHLCFAKKHPMAFRVQERKTDAHLFYLRVDRAILYQDGVQFSTGVGYAQGVQTVPVEEACNKEMIDYEVLYTWMPWDDPKVQARRNEAEMCEILVPDYIPMEFIRNFPNG